MKHTHTPPQLSAFLDACKQSSEQAISALHTLIETLENPSTQKEGVTLLRSVVDFAANKPEEEIRKMYHFHFFDMEIPKGLNGFFTLKLLQLPSTFAPEDWSFTFFEGLSRYPFSEFHNKQMVELGCGNGWISLSMAMKYSCSKIYGLDINPKAILCSKINLYLNAFNTNGELIFFEDGTSLLDKVDFKVSDLLGCFYDKQNTAFDVIIGCIPQVLAPEDTIDNSKISDEANDEFLHSLSNYASEQGYVEDKFGLGLIARSVEESIDLLKPQGKLILNLGERPRREVLERLVKRRGMLINRIWTRKVEQANDTDIDSLVRLEKEMNHHFEFYTDLHSETAINARTAKLFATKGGRIYHNLSVYECTFDYYTETKSLFDELKNELFAEAKTGLDLDYEESGKKEEKIRFLSELAKNLRQTDYFPYEDNRGEIGFRKTLADFLRAYQHVNLTEEHILITPNLASLIENVLDVYTPGTIFLSETLFDLFPEHQSKDSFICTPDCSKELNTLIEQVRPQIVVAKIKDNATFTGESFQRIVEVSKAANARLFLDISDCLELSSSPESIGVFQYLAKNQLPIHVSLVCELSKNQIYRDLKTCFVISSSQTLIDNLKNVAEFSYSRSPYLSQLFYTILVKDLTSFHMKSVKSDDVEQLLSNEDEQYRSKFILRTDRAGKSFEHSAIQGNELMVNEETVRFDYGENELACPDDLKISILESFTKQNLAADECDPKVQLMTFVSNRFGIRKASEIVYGNGVAPLFAGIAKMIRDENGTLVIPRGAYGYFHATAQFYGTAIKIIPTTKENNFIPQKADLENTLEECDRPWIFLNFPLVNPTGALWSDENMRSILSAKGIEKSRIIVDTVFSGLEFEGVKQSTVLAERENDLNFIILGGISKEYSAGGIRFGFALFNFQCNLARQLNYTPHDTVKFAAKKIYAKYLDGDNRVTNALKIQVDTLKERAIRLSTLLAKNGWEVLPPQGGLFLVASPKALHGKKIRLRSGEEMEINATTISTILHDQQNMLINNDEWTGIPAYCRFVLSVKESVFVEGLRRIEKFHEFF